MRGPFFNENIPLRHLPIVINHVAGAMEIQKYFDDRVDRGLGRRRLLCALYPQRTAYWDVSKVDPHQLWERGRVGPIPEPHSCLAPGAMPTLRRSIATTSHTRKITRSTRTRTPTFRSGRCRVYSGPIGRGGMEQFAIFLASHGKTIVHPEPARFFEVPISPPLPEISYNP